MDFEEHLRESYNAPGHPLAFSNVKKIYDYYEGQLSEERIKEILSSLESHSIHKEFKKGQRNISHSNFKRYQFQCDLIDVSHLAPYNDGVSYLFACIDTFTRFAFVRLLTTKHSSCAIRAFDSILQEAKDMPHTLVMDRGTEFTSEAFEKFCEALGISYFPPDSSSHGAYIERFNRTLQGHIYRFMTENETYRYIDLVDPSTSEKIPLMPYFLMAYNNSVHRMIGTTPAIAEFNPSTHLEIRKKMSEYHEKIKRKKIFFNVGDLVRIVKIKGKFDRGYNQRATDEIFKIHSVVEKKIPMYVLSDFNGEEIIKGSFYAFELVKVNMKEFRIEKVLQSRTRNGKKEHFVKWRGYGDSYNSWVDDADITRVF